jgi:hypothetical protein
MLYALYSQSIFLQIYAGLAKLANYKFDNTANKNVLFHRTVSSKACWPVRLRNEKKYFKRKKLCKEKLFKVDHFTFPYVCFLELTLNGFRCETFCNGLRLMNAPHNIKR